MAMKKLLLPTPKRVFDRQQYNMVRHLSWGVMGTGLAIALIGLPGLVEGPVPYVPILTDLYRGLASELVGIGFTVAVVDAFIRWNALKEEKRRLIRELGGGVNTTARNAARELRERGWLTDGSLQGVDLKQADLREADLENTDLQRADLVVANLQGAVLNDANLQGANLGGACLQKTNLVDANLQRADLLIAKLQGASLTWANLQGANLEKAKLQGANLRDADLRGADLWRANLQRATLQHADLRGAILGKANLRGAALQYTDLQGARYVTCSQLQQAKTLQSTALPDGYKLSHFTWREAFKAWRKIAETDEDGYIIPVKIDDNDG